MIGGLEDQEVAESGMPAKLKRQSTPESSRDKVSESSTSLNIDWWKGGRWQTGICPLKYMTWCRWAFQTWRSCITCQSKGNSCPCIAQTEMTMEYIEQQRVKVA